MASRFFAAADVAVVDVADVAGVVGADAVGDYLRVGCWFSMKKH